MQNARLNESQAGIKIARRNIKSLRYADDTTNGRSEEELKSLLMRVKKESEKAGLKLNIQKERVGKTWQTVNDFPGLQNHCSDCSNETKRRLLLGRKATTNLDSVLQSRDITLPTKVHIHSKLWFFH